MDGVLTDLGALEQPLVPDPMDGVPLNDQLQWSAAALVSSEGSCIVVIVGWPHKGALQGGILKLESFPPSSLVLRKDR